MKIYDDCYFLQGRNKYEKAMSQIESERVNAFLQKHNIISEITPEEFFALNTSNDSERTIAYVKAERLPSDKHIIYCATAYVNDTSKVNNYGHDLIISKSYGDSLQNALNNLLGKGTITEKLGNIQFCIEMTDGYLKIGAENGQNLYASLARNDLDENSNQTTGGYATVSETLNGLNSLLGMQLLQGDDPSSQFLNI